MINGELSRVFDRIGDLLEIDGADGFRVNSYRRAARSIKECHEDVALLAREKRLTELPGVGKGTADRIQQYLDHGSVDVLAELQEKYPATLIDLLDIPGMGPKKVALAHRELGVNDLAGLKRVIASGELATLPGLGEKSAAKIAEGISFLERSGGRTPLGVALPIAQAFAERVRALKGVRQVEVAGSLRRGAETIGDIDLLCDSDEGGEIVKQFTAFEGVKRVLVAGDTKGSVTVALDDRRELQVDLRVVPAESFGAAWQYFTGSKEHNVRLREMAVKRKWRLNEYGLYDGEKLLAGRREEDIYARLGLPFVPPELREDRGEFEEEVQARFDELISLEHIRGDLHMHTVASDGHHTIEEMAAGAKARGYAFIAICDHSPSSTIANGLSVARMGKHMAAIRAANERTKGIEILVGCECDILPNGELDYPDEILAECDWVVASIHSAMGSGGEGKLSPTERTISAMRNRFVCAIGHPTGRLINKRAAMEMDMGAVVQEAARTGTLLEINASWQRLDLKDVHVRQALGAGVTLCINTDAHAVEQLDQMGYGVLTARRGGATKKYVANTLTLAGLRKLIARKRDKSH